MAKTVKIDLKKTIYDVYQKQGLEATYQWVCDYNKFISDTIPYERCNGCEANTPSIKHECCICGQKTKKQGKPKFYQAVLKRVDDVITHVYPHSRGTTTLEERMPNNATCSECGGNEWMLLANEQVAVKEGGKPYCECLSCGYLTHL